MQNDPNITSKVIAASRYLSDTTEHIFVTVENVVPKVLLQEINTHRQDVVKNASSSRAIPTARFISNALETPLYPMWRRNQPGMMGKDDFSDEEISALNAEFDIARLNAVASAERIAALGAAKENVNRVLEPYAYARQVMSFDLNSPGFKNFLRLRNHEAAQPEFKCLVQALEVALQAVREENGATLLQGPYDWHLPYSEGLDGAPITDRMKVSVARCARASYLSLNSNGRSDISSDIKLYDKLLEQGHLSPFEHQVTPRYSDTMVEGVFDDWIQLRHVLEKNCLEAFTGE